MSERPFMQFYPSDFVGDTLHLTAEEVGAYMLLLMAMWNANGTLPNDEKKLARISRLHLNKWRVVASGVLEFFVVDGERLTHTRMQKELEKLDIRTRVCRENGRRGGLAKSLKTNDPDLAKAKQRLQHTRNHNHIDKKTEAKASSKKGTRLPDDWSLPSEWRKWAIEAGLDPPDVQHEADQFRDWWHAKTGKDATKRDWQATWRTWIRNNIKRNGKVNGYGQRRQQASGPEKRTFAEWLAPKSEAEASGGSSDGFSGPTIDLSANGRDG